MYFILNENDYSGDRSAIGDIMQKVSNDLYKKTGLSLSLYLGPSKEELEAYYCANNLEPVLEEILWKNMTPDEQVNKFVEYISEIGGVSGELLIVDPYLFPKKCDENYVSTLSTILNRSQCTAITTVTDSNNFNDGVFQAVQQSVCIKIKNVFSGDFHDRYWIANKTKGFLSGSSLNGIGRRISCILMLNPNDVEIIVNEIDAIE